jgi:predicted permease
MAEVFVSTAKPIGIDEAVGPWSAYCFSQRTDRLGMTMQALYAALQSLSRVPRFSVAAILTLSSGIAAMTTVAALAYAMLMAPLAVPAGHEVLAVTRAGQTEASVSLPDAMALRPRLSTFQALSAIDTRFALDWVRSEGPVRLRGALVESDYFAVVGAPPLLGRVTRAADDLDGAAPVVVLRESFWRSAFGADPSILGQQLTLSGVSAQIIGVVGDGADLYETDADLFAPFPPFAPWALGSPGSNTFELVGRAADVDAARAQLNAVSADIARSNGTEKVLDAQPLIDLIVAPVRPALIVLLAAVASMLLLVAANVLALTRVRTSQREAEWSTRAALGASDARLRAQLLIEALALCGCSAALGGALATLLYGVLRSTLGEALPRLASADASGPLLLVPIGLTLALAVAIGSLSMARVGGSRSVGGSRRHLRGLRWLIVAEIGLAGALLGAALLLAQSFLALVRVPLGFEPAHAIRADVVLPEGEYSERSAQTRAFVAMVDALAEASGVERAAMVVGLPLTGNTISHSMMFDGGGEGSAAFRPIIGDYFSVLQIPLRAGRGVAPGDGDGERVAWVNESFAARYFPDRDPIGARVAIPPGEAGPAESPQWMRIVGVVSDVRSNSLRESEGAALYAPYVQREASWVRFGTLVAQIRGAAPRYRELLQAAVSAGAPDVPVGETGTLATLTERAFARDRWVLQLIALFAAFALLLTIQGVFCVVAFSVQQRRAEIGLRIALGAAPRDTGTLMLREGAATIALGCLVALGLLAVVNGLLGQVLYGVSAVDPATLTASLLLIAGSAALAIWWPTRSAAKMDVAALLMR